jgi:hypothetical protein
MPLTQRAICVTFDETSFPFSKTTSSTLTNDITPSPTNIWLSSLLYFTTCTQPSLLGPIPSFNSHTHSHPPTPTTSTSISNPIPILPATTSTLELILEITNIHNSALPTNPPETHTTTLPNPPAIPEIHHSPLTAPQTQTITDNHPMQTRLKSGISKKKVGLYLYNSGLS